MLLPTRQRRKWAERLLNSVARESAHPEAVEVVIRVDADDTNSHGIDHPDLRIIELIGPQRSMGDYNSDALEASHGEIIVLVNDDMVIRTPDWDERLRAVHAEYADGVYLSYGNDLFKGRNLCVFPILSRRCCEWLVEPYPRAYQGAFIDYHLFDVFKRLEKAGYNRIRYLDDVIFEHLHFRASKAPLDAIYASRPRFGDDPMFLALSSLRQAQANWLVEAIQNKTAQPTQHVWSHISSASPRNLFDATVQYTHWIFLDRNLPLRWRFRLWVWFLVRYLVSGTWRSKNFRIQETTH